MAVMWNRFELFRFVCLVFNFNSVVKACAQFHLKAFQTACEADLIGNDWMPGMKTLPLPLQSQSWSHVPSSIFDQPQDLHPSTM